MKSLCICSVEVSLDLNHEAGQMFEPRLALLWQFMPQNEISERSRQMS